MPLWEALEWSGDPRSKVSRRCFVLFPARQGWVPSAVVGPRLVCHSGRTQMAVGGSYSIRMNCRLFNFIYSGHVHTQTVRIRLSK
jgi:hypothetical protein